MDRSPREVVELVRRMVAGEGVVFADLFAEDGVLRFPFAPPGMPREIRGPRRDPRVRARPRTGSRALLDMDGVELSSARPTTRRWSSPRSSTTATRARSTGRTASARSAWSACATARSSATTTTWTRSRWPRCSAAPATWPRRCARVSARRSGARGAAPLLGASAAASHSVSTASRSATTARSSASSASSRSGSVAASTICSCSPFSRAASASSRRSSRAASLRAARCSALERGPPSTTGCRRHVAGPGRRSAARTRRADAPTRCGAASPTAASRPRRARYSSIPPGRCVIFPSPEQRDDRVAHPLHQVTVVADHDERARPAVEQVFQPGERVDVQVVGRLVQQQHVGLGHQEPGELQPPPLAAGELPDRRPLPRRREPQPLQHRRRRELQLPQPHVLRDVLGGLQHAHLVRQVDQLLRQLRELHRACRAPAARRRAAAPP